MGKFVLNGDTIQLKQNDRIPADATTVCTAVATRAG